MNPLRTVAASIAIALSLVGCQTPQPQSESAPEPPLVVPAETPIAAMTLTRLESGVSGEGEGVVLVVAENVTIGGKVAIPKGTPVTARVVRSRKANLLSMVANQPARLEIEPESLLLPDGGACGLKANMGEAAPLALTRELGGSKSPLGSLLDDPVSRKTLESLAEAVESGDVAALADDPAAQNALSDALGKLGVTGSESLVEPNQLRRADDALKTLRAGKLLDLATGDASSAVSAAFALVGVAGEVGRGLARKLDAPNIRIPAGTRLTFYTVDSVEVSPRKPAHS